MAATSVSISLHYLNAPTLGKETAMINDWPVQTTVVATPTTSKQSAAAPATLGAHAYWRILPLGGAVHVAEGADPTADTDDMQVAAGAEFYVRAYAGRKVAVIDA